VYTSGTLSLAVLELLVHTDPDLVPADLQAFEVEIPRSLEPAMLEPDRLPPGWRRIAIHPACRALGDAWAAELRHAVLGVPSVVVPEERNFLINPAHPEAAEVRVVRVRDFTLDRRLL
jgi:RES domain-containing protein